MGAFVVGLVFALCAVAPATSQPRCILSREDTVPCQYLHPNLDRAGPNEFTTHSTRIFQSDINDPIECRVRPARQNRTEIPCLGSDELRVLYSPGFDTEQPYQPQLRVEYKVQCGVGELVFFNITTLSTRGEEDCQDSAGNDRCQDYLQIIRPPFGGVEECGTTPSSSSLLQLENGRFTVVFRTSEKIFEGGGFEMYVLCYRPLETGMDGCIETTSFTSGFCGGERSTEQKRSACPEEVTFPPIATFYSELFPNSGYPPNLPIPFDLAQFHHRWSKLRGRPGFKITQVNIRFSETLNYDDNTLTLMDRDGNVINSYTNVDILDTFDSNGVIERHGGQSIGPLFPGSAIMTIVNKYASLQLFRFDPREVIPTEEELRELNLMNRPLLDSIIVNRTSDFRPILRRKRASAGHPIITLDDELAVMAALRSENSCNAVLRADSRATLLFYSESDVNSLRTFDISCTSSRNMTCLPESTTVPDLTTCQFNGQEPMMCDPFREPVLIPQSTEVVTVSTYNCDGQKAERMVNFG